MQIFKFTFFVIFLFVGTASAVQNDSAEEKKIHDAVVMTTDFLTKARFKTGDYDLRNCFHKDANSYGGDSSDGEAHFVLVSSSFKYIGYEMNKDGDMDFTYEFEQLAEYHVTQKIIRKDFTPKAYYEKLDKEQNEKYKGKKIYDPERNFIAYMNTDKSKYQLPVTMRKDQDGVWKIFDVYIEDLKYIDFDLKEWKDYWATSTPHYYGNAKEIEESRNIDKERNNIYRIIYGKLLAIKNGLKPESVNLNDKK